MEAVNYRIYVTDMLKSLAEVNRVKVKVRYADLLHIESKKKEKRTAEEIIQAMLDKTGVKLTE